MFDALKKVKFSIKFDFKNLIAGFVEWNNCWSFAMKFFCDETKKQKTFWSKNYKELRQRRFWAMNQCLRWVFEKVSSNQHECFWISCLLKFFESFFVDVDCDVRICCFKIWLFNFSIIEEISSKYFYRKLSSICQKISFSLFEEHLNF